MSITASLDFLAAMDTAPGTTAEEVSLQQLRADPKQPRKLKPEGDDELQGLADNIRANGIINPITVRRDPENADIFLIISGERRWRASKLAGLNVVPCRILAVEDEAHLRLMQLSENLQREDMNLLDTAQAIEEILATSGMKQKELAKQLGKGEDYVSGLRLIARSEGQVRLALADGVIQSPYAFRLFTQLNDQEQQVLIRTARSGKRSIGRSELMQRLGKLGAVPAARASTKKEVREFVTFTLTEEEAVTLLRKLGITPPASSSYYAAALKAHCNILIT